MNKQFSFSILINGSFRVCNFEIATENGFVITNYYCPKSLLIGESELSQMMTPLNGESEMEFIHDCQNIVNKANSKPKYNIFSCFEQALSTVIDEHINRCGRLIFGDLLLYVDCFAYLLKSVGFMDADIKRYYPCVVKRIVDSKYQYVKESQTLMPIQSTNLYQILCRLAK